jgi:hypothetical protein
MSIDNIKDLLIIYIILSYGNNRDSHKARIKKSFGFWIEAN